MHQMKHTPTSETALIRDHDYDKDLLLAQFDRLDHPHSHGWTAYPRKDFEEIEEIN